MRVYAQKCGKIEVEIEIEIEAEIEGNRTFGPDVGWLSVMRTGGAWKNQELGMRNGGGGAQIGKRRLLNCGWWDSGIVRQWGRLVRLIQAIQPPSNPFNPSNLFKPTHPAYDTNQSAVRCQL